MKTTFTVLRPQLWCAHAGRQRSQRLRRFRHGLVELAVKAFLFERSPNAKLALNCGASFGAQEYLPVMALLADGVAIAFFSMVLIGMTPMIASFGQFLLVGLHARRNHYDRCADYTPRVAFILPAWNEADVIGASIDALMSISYPAGFWRIFVVDDASTDDTPSIMRAKIAQYPGSVVHLRREVGGQGKAYTLNHGLKAVLSDEWAEAVMIMDADVLFEPLTLRRMTRHLADPAVGAVTAYVKEGSEPGNLITRSIAFEYITAQAASRRAQNVVGVLACLAGGAQLHSRANLLAIGGAIDTSTLAEDTGTTFKTQLHERKAVFEGSAIVWAEEPDTLAGLWRQRMRWARGNLQVTAAYRHIWFRSQRFPGLRGYFFGTIWFSVVLMPLFTILRSIGLIGLYVMHSPLALAGFETLWGGALVLFLFETSFALAIDPATARRAWLPGLLYPGMISLAFMVLACVPVSRLVALGALTEPLGAADPLHATLNLMIFGWGIIAIGAGWGIYRLEKAGCPAIVRDLLLALFGYGSVIAAVSMAAMVEHWRKVEIPWYKTVKTGKARILR